MRKFFLVTLVAIGSVLVFSGLTADQKPAAPADWSMNATLIEACSCPMFCQCFFGTKTAAHATHEGEQRFCRANIAAKVNRGHFGKVKLDGVRYWIAGDLGDDIADGEGEWYTVTFEPKTTQEQRDALKAILGYVYPLKWKSASMGSDAGIEWKTTPDGAHARLNDGKAAEIILRRSPGMSGTATVIHNLRYDGAPRNSGIILMPNEVEAYKLGDKAFEFKGTTGFMVTIDITSKDVAAAKAM
ncbi:MAG TPA: DUF1326 domain-containing protein [Terriglobia bacterium]|nr:DUF1326 domain-containing protein [Terriglobia bacterium]